MKGGRQQKSAHSGQKTDAIGRKSDMGGFWRIAALAFFRFVSQIKAVKSLAGREIISNFAAKL
ncbi:MAG: hypothetical protein IJ243_05970 [Prevotella sp.]|nr:hypothetical protein [Prevotella sp.]